MHAIREVVAVNLCSEDDYPESMSPPDICVDYTFMRAVVYVGAC